MSLFSETPLFPLPIYQKIELLAQHILAEKHIFVTAESCTGGLIAAACTEVPGSSAWFYGSVVSYDNSVKIHALGVEKTTLAQKGAVSCETVVEMVKGALHALQGTVGVAVSGIAGPSGGSFEKPVGTVWIATAVMQEKILRTDAQLFTFFGNRSQIRLQAVDAALSAVIQALKNL